MTPHHSAPPDNFDAAGYGAIPVGWGLRPALLAVDFQRAFTDPAFPAGRSGHVRAAMARTLELVAAAKAAGVLTVACRTAWESPRDMIPWKTAAVRTGLFHGDPATELDPAMAAAGPDVTLVKAAPSIFFGTTLPTTLARHGIDTVIVTGCTTSGCVRASIVDAFSHGYRVIVPEDACGDMEPGPHAANLLDVGRRYADVTTTADCLARLAALAPRPQPVRAHA